MTTTTQHRPFIVSFLNQKDAQNFDVVVNHPDVTVANQWTDGYFGRVEYLHSDSEGNHTYRRVR